MNILNYSISPRAKRKLLTLLEENPLLERILDRDDYGECKELSHRMLNRIIAQRPAVARYLSKERAKDLFGVLTWSDYALIRIYNYLKYSGKTFTDLNVKSRKSLSDPLKMLWLAYRSGTGGAKHDFFVDMVFLFRQLRSRKIKRRPSVEEVKRWMDKHPSGLDKDLVEIRNANKKRIIDKFIELQDKGFYKPSRLFRFPKNAGYEEKYNLVNQWWNDHRFHLRYAIRDYKTLDIYLDKSLSPNKMEVFKLATRKGLPFFVNFYYLSLINTRKSGKYVGADIPLRDYIFYNRDLINEFGHIVAWEKEDVVEAGKPNAAGWILPNDHNIHRRYPEVAIFIPDSMGRSCGGLCVSCQRMYDFQKGHLNFNLDKLKPRKSWDERMKKLLGYFENDPDLRDILITGGDSLMSSNTTLRKILDEVYEMAKRKAEANKSRPEGEKYALMQRIRLGTRLPVYIPQRIDDELIEILSNFRRKAEKIGFRQFIIQTHFISAMEITPEAEKAIERLLSAGWMVTNQAVFTTAASRRGHMAKLRAELNKTGVLTYYTFSVKGYRENRYNFATNARLAQELFEEKYFGKIDDKELEILQTAKDIKQAVNDLRTMLNLPFLATDRSIMNLPGIGKSLTFSVIGITNDGRRILRFKHDSERRHGPVVSQTDDVIIVESKSVKAYLDQLEKKGCDADDYDSIYGYSMFITEKRKKIFTYPKEIEGNVGMRG